MTIIFFYICSSWISLVFTTRVCLGLILMKFWIVNRYLHNDAEKISDKMFSVNELANGVNILVPTLEHR